MSDWTRQVAENSARYARLAEHLARLSITEASGDGTVKVTVSANGLLTDITLRERWHPTPLPAIAEEIMDCVRRAQARIPELLRQAMSDIVGDEEPGTGMLLDEAARRFPEPEDTAVEPKRPAAPRARTSPQQDEDYWGERPVLEDV